MDGGLNIQTFVEAFGLPGAMILALGWYCKKLIDKNEELNSEVRKTLREIIPLVQQLSEAEKANEVPEGLAEIIRLLKDSREERHEESH